MRTDTQTFRKRIIRDLRAAGLPAYKARRCAAALHTAAYFAGNPIISDAAVARIVVDGPDFQRVIVEADGVTIFAGEPSPECQPLVLTEPTAEQQALSQDLVDMLPDVFGAIGDAISEGISDPHTAPAVIAANAAYDAKRDAILAINPHVHAGVADPAEYETYHMVHKSVYGFRPRGFITLDTMKRVMDSIAQQQIEEERLAA